MIVVKAKKNSASATKPAPHPGSTDSTAAWVNCAPSDGCTPGTPVTMACSVSLPSSSTTRKVLYMPVDSTRKAVEVRSEERRVGKERRARWSPCDENKTRVEAADRG